MSSKIFLEGRTKDLIKQAYEHSKRRFFINRKNERLLFENLNLITEKNAVSELFPLVFCKNKRLVTTVAQVVHQILKNLPISEFSLLNIYPSLEWFDLKLEYFSRMKFKYFSLIKDNAVDIVRQIDIDEAVQNSMIALLCFHPNGYIREKATKALSQDYSKLSIPVLLVRVNDWVSKISHIAEVVLLKIIKTRDANEFLPSLLLIAQLNQKNRYDHSVLINEIEKNLSEECYEEMLRSILDPNKYLRREAFKIASKNAAQIVRLINISRKSDDLMINLKTIDVAKVNLPQNELFNFLYDWLQDKPLVIRRNCIYCLLDKFPEKSTKILLTLLFDKIYSLRELARFYLKKTGINDFENIYRTSILENNKPLQIAIMGLAEVGGDQAFAVIEPFISNSDLKIKVACIYSVFKLHPESRQDLISEQLPSDEPMILKAICNGIIKNPESVDINSLEKKFCQKGGLYSENLFIKTKIAIMNDRWYQIDYMLEYMLYGQYDDIKLSFLMPRINRWVTGNSTVRIFIKPNINLLNRLLVKTEELIAKGQNESLYKRLKSNLQLYQ